MPIKEKHHEDTSDAAVIVIFAGKNSVSLMPWTRGTIVIESDGKLSVEILRAGETGLFANMDHTTKLTSTVLQQRVVAVCW